MIRFYDEKPDDEVFVKIEDGAVWLCDKNGRATCGVVNSDGGMKMFSVEQQTIVENAGIALSGAVISAGSLAEIVAYMAKKLNKLTLKHGATMCSVPNCDTLDGMIDEFKATCLIPTTACYENAWRDICRKYVEKWNKDGK